MSINEVEKGILIDNMTKNLPMLRTALGLTQEGLGELIGLSRFTIMSIENGKRRMTWNTFLLLILIFIKNKETERLLKPLGIYTENLDENINLHGSDNKK